MPVVSKSASASLCKRLACASVVASLCVPLGACDNDADAPHDAATQIARKATDATDASANASPTTAQTDAQSDQQPQSAPPALMIQTPQTTQNAPLSASDAAASLSAVAPEPLATPVIHTVD